MRILALTRRFLRDHTRTNAILMEIILVLLFAAVFFQPRFIMQNWNYLITSISLFSIVMAGLGASLLTWRNSDQKLDFLLVKAGKCRYLFGVWLASLAVSFFWLMVVGIYGYFFLQETPPLEELSRFLAAVGSIVLVVSVLFLFFSSLTGKKYEPALAVIFILLNFSSQHNIYSAIREPWSHVVYLFPPVLENLQAVTKYSPTLPLIRTLLYTAAVLILGISRFYRKQFIHS